MFTYKQSGISKRFNQRTFLQSKNTGFSINGKEFELMNNDDKNLSKTFIDAFLTKRQVQQLAQ